MAAFIAGLAILMFFFRMFWWNDPSAPPGAVIGIRSVAKWGRCGLMLAAAAFLFALPAKWRPAVVSLASTVVFASFWLVIMLLALG
jgi:hypothetical protein